VINKIDSPQANIGKTIEEIKALGFSEDEIIKVSAKTGENVEEVIETIIKKVPSPRTRPGLGSSLSVSKKAWPLAEGLQALIFDSSLDPYKGVIATIRLFGGEIKIGNQILLLATKTRAEVLQIGYLTPKPTQVEKISDGEVGYIITNIKNLSCVKVGDTVTTVENPANSLPGYQEAKPVVFLSFYPTDPHDHEKLKTGLEKLKLNDAALNFSSESSTSLGQGFRCGFLGLLHAQITQERLEREYDLDIIVTSPSVNFEVDGEIINKAQQFNPQARSLKEPIAIVTIFAPKKYMGVISNLIYDKRGEQKHIENIGNALKIEAEIPLIELLIGFYDQLKSATSGFASFDFEIGEYRESKLVKLDILVNHEQVEGLSQVVHKDKSETFGRKLVEKLKDIIPRQQIAIPLQAAIGGKIIARETIPAFRKDVTQKLYGGDVTRKKKLLEKQKKGKKRMRRFGNIDIPQEAFLAVLKI
ncbi:elongation factor 4, partial [Candidatus Curtissbacteria bacterium RIFCSPLOWO2_12_FULL_38_9]